MAAGGLVQGLLWMGMTTGAQGGVFVVLVFLAAMLFALGTGTRDVYKRQAKSGA